MAHWMQALVYVGAAVMAFAAAGLMLRDDAPGRRTVLALAVLEFILIVQAVVGVYRLGATSRDLEQMTFLAYLIGALLVAPAGALWAMAERTRAGTAVLLVAAVTLVVFELRLAAIWKGEA